MTEYEALIDGKWCPFYAGHTNLFDEFEINNTFDITKDKEVYGRAIVGIVSWRPAYMYHTFKTTSIRIKKPNVS